MAKVTGFIEHNRKDRQYIDVKQRLKNFKLVLPTDYKRALSNNEQVYKVKARKKG